jgi:hypothetical protein
LIVAIGRLKRTDLAPKLAAFDRIFSGIVAHREIMLEVRKRFIAEFPWTKSTTQIEQMLQDTLGTVPWKWHWHREWRDRFEAVGAYPRMWTTLSKVRPNALRETGSYDHRIFLLAHTLTHKGYGEQIWDQTFIDPPLIYIDNPMRDEHPAVLAILHECIEAYANGDSPAEPPPFFPGDRTGARLVHPQHPKPLERIEKLGRICLRRPPLSA